MTDLVKVDPKEFGLEENQVSTIEQAFLPKIHERELLSEIYETVLKSELTPELCSKAKETRLKLVKVRTGIAEIHKTQKAFFLAAGRFVDAWKNKETAPIEQMEERLSEIENYYINLEKERISKLEKERVELVLAYSDVVPAALGNMNQQVFDNYLSGLKLAYEARIKAEQEAEAERLRLIEVEKENARLKAIEDERIRKENERLKAEAEAREREIEAERKKQADLLAKQKAEAEAEQNRLLQIEREKQAKLEAELRAKEAAEAASKAEADRKEKERIEAEKKAAKAPDKIKLKNYIDSMSIELPKCSTKEAEQIALLINSKFIAFTTWAKSQIETI